MNPWYRGGTRILTLTVTTDGVARDISGAAIEYALKAALSDPDPALIALSVGNGVVLRAQAGATLGQADITISSELADTLAPGLYVEEVVAIFEDGTRDYVVPARTIEVRPVVNRR